MNTSQKSVSITESNNEGPYYFENFDWFEEEFASFNPFGSFLSNGTNDFEVSELDEKPVQISIINRPIMKSWFDIMEEDEEEERTEKEAQEAVKMNEDRQSFLITLQLRKILLSMGMYELEEGEVLDL